MIRYYCIYDNSLQQANPPFACSDDKSAVRMVRNMLISADNAILERVKPVCDLRFVGSFDEVACKFEAISDPVLVCSLASIPVPDVPGGAE